MCTDGAATLRLSLKKLLSKYDVSLMHLDGMCMEYWTASIIEGERKGEISDLEWYKSNMTVKRGYQPLHEIENHYIYFKPNITFSNNDKLNLKNSLNRVISGELSPRVESDQILTVCCICDIDIGKSTLLALSCGHANLCRNCIDIIFVQGLACPMCRVKPTYTLKVFLCDPRDKK